MLFGTTCLPLRLRPPRSNLRRGLFRKPPASLEDHPSGNQFIHRYVTSGSSPLHPPFASERTLATKS